MRQRSKALIQAGEEPKTPATLRPGSLVGLLAEVPEEEVWLANLRSERTSRAYQGDVRDFIAALDIRTRGELYAVRPAAVIAWRQGLAARGLKNSSVRRKLAAVSSLFGHLVARHLAETNPARDVERPNVNRVTGSTAAFSEGQARRMMDAPPRDTLGGKRDRAILSLGFQAGPRRAEIAHMTVGDLRQNQGVWCLRYVRKGGDEHEVALHPETYTRIREYVEHSGHGGNPDAPLFLPLRGNHVPGTEDLNRHLDPDAVDKLVRKWARKALGVSRGFSAHSMRATFITRTLDAGCPLERVQKDVGHRQPSTTSLYDRRNLKPEEAATMYANYSLSADD